VTDKDHAEVRVTDDFDYVPRITLSSWCVECPVGNASPAEYIYQGNGLCRKHFAGRVGLV